MAYRNKTYVAFDGDNDITNYRIMQAWKSNDNIDFNFLDAHDLNTARDSSNEESIKAQLRVRMQNSKLFLLLVGENTYRCTKFVKWEIESAIRRKMPIIVVNLNGIKSHDNTLCPSILDNVLALHIPFKKNVIQYAIDNWPMSHDKLSREMRNGPYKYTDIIYDRLNK